MARAIVLPSWPDFFKTLRMKTKTLQLRNLMNRSSLRAFLLIPFVLVCFALSPQGRATCQDACLTNFSTVQGDDALLNNIGTNNTAIGFNALLANTIGSDNTAIGVGALGDNKSGSNNIAVGFLAGENLDHGDNNIVIGNAGNPGASNSIHIGSRETHTATFIAGISGVAVTGSQVIVNSNGKLGVTVSSARFKDEVKPMDEASEAILALKPVTFRYKHELDPNGIPQFGLVAEDVEKVNPDLVARDADGRPYTVRYEAVNAMLLNEFLKEHRKIEQQRKDFEADLAKQQKQIEALNVSLEKMSAQIELSNPCREPR
jgi:hypothetical protein